MLEFSSFWVNMGDRKERERERKPKEGGAARNLRTVLDEADLHGFRWFPLNKVFSLNFVKITGFPKIEYKAFQTPGTRLYTLE